MNEVITTNEKKIFAQSNVLSLASYKMSLMESKIMAVSLFYAKDMVRVEHGDKVPTLRSQIPVDVLKKLFDAKRGDNFYRDLSKAAIGMMGKVIGYNNPQEHCFRYSTFITDAQYKNGIFTIDYNYNFKPYLLDLKQRFTTFDLTTVLNFESVYAYRMYCILKTKYNLEKWKNEDKDTVKVSIPFSELLFKLGLISTENKTIRQMVEGRVDPNFDKALSMVSKKHIKYGTWYDFSRYVLTPSINEINKNTELGISYEKEQSGQGGKVSGIRFSIWKKGYSLKTDDEFASRVLEVLPFECSGQEMEKICRAAEGDMEKINSAVSVYNEQQFNIENPVPWFVKAVKDGYQSKLESMVYPEETPACDSTVDEDDNILDMLGDVFC